MFAQKEDHSYVPSKGKSLAAISQGELPGVHADDANQMNAIRELFFEARLKPGYVEVRSVDGQVPADRFASVAFWAGLLYSPEARRHALKLLDLTPDDRQKLFNSALIQGLSAKLGKQTLRELSGELLTPIRETLKRRCKGEDALLLPVEETLETGKNPAQRLIDKFQTSWKQDFSKVIQYASGETG